MKEIKYLCDECREKVSEGCIGASPTQSTLNVSITFDIKSLESYSQLFCSLACFSKYYAKKRLHDAGVKYA